ncbi:MAG: Tyrosine recombinase XerC [Anaerolineae bacterium]|nr:Tyrosine recombinase XerC [Anaerolineae bacterium]
MNTLQPIQPRQLSVVDRLLMNKTSPRTRAAYADDLQHFAAFLGVDSSRNLADSDFQHFDPALIAAYAEWLKQQISAHTGRPYATATIARRLTAVRELLTEATFLGLYPREFLDYIRERLSSPEVTSQHHGTITPDEQDRLLALAAEQPGLKGSRDYALFRLWLDTGLRRNELASLKAGDLVVKNGVPTLIVRHGKGNKLREIGLESYTAYVVQQWLDESGQLAHPDYPLFCQVRKVGRAEEATYTVVNPDKHLLGVALNQLVSWYCREAGVQSKVTPHSFRVALVTDMLDGGAPIQHVQKVTGHTTTRMITDIYDRNQYAEPVARYRKRTLRQRDS